MGSAIIGLGQTGTAEPRALPTLCLDQAVSGGLFSERPTMKAPLDKYGSEVTMIDSTGQRREESKEPLTEEFALMAATVNSTSWGTAKKFLLLFPHGPFSICMHASTSTLTGWRL